MTLFFNPFDIPMRTPNPFGYFHMIYIVLAIVGIILVNKFAHKDQSEKSKKIFLWTVLTVIWVLFFVKIYDYYRHGDWGIDVVNTPPWMVFPLQFCDTPMYVLLLVMLIPNEKFKKIGLTYLATFSIIAGSLVLLLPSEVFRDRLIVSNQTMIHHVLMILLSIFIWKTDDAGTLKDHFKASGLLLGFIFLGLFLNILLHKASNGIINNFFINPYLPTPLPVFGAIQKVSYILFVLLYMLLFILAGLGVYYVGTHREKIFSVFSKIKQTPFNEQIISTVLFFIFVSFHLFLLYFVFNSKYFTTTPFFSLPLHMRVNGFIGNLMSLGFLGSIIFLMFPNFKDRVTGLIIVSVIISIIFIAQIEYARNMNTLLDLNQLNLMKNPAGSLGFSLFKQSIIDFFSLDRFHLIIPTILFSIISVLIVKNISVIKTKTSYIKRFAISAIILLVSFNGGLLSYQYYKANQTWHLDAHQSVYGAQASGFMNYYVGSSIKPLNKKVTYDNDKIHELSHKYNKNEATYKDIYGNLVSSTLNRSDYPNIEISPKIHGDTLNGIFKGKNLFYIQIETFNHFLLGLEENSVLNSDKVFPNLKKILNESYVFENFYQTVGVAHSSDGQYSTLAGLHPVGNRTLYWDHEEKPFKIPQTLPILFKESGYETAMVEADVKEFYNIGTIADHLYRFDHLYYYDRHKNFDDPYNGKHAFPHIKSITGKPLKERFSNHTEGLDDTTMVSWLDMIKNNLKAPYLVHPITLHPHVPYFGMKEKLDIKVDKKMTGEGRRLLDYILYMDSYFEAFIELFKKTENAVFIFYSDHGATGYHKKDLEILLGKKMTDLEYQRELRHINAFIYVPDDDYKGEGIKPGLFKGRQPLMRSQIDLYRTTLELFGIESHYHYYGVNALSNEKTFVLDPKTFMLITDEYMIDALNFHKKKAKNRIIYFKDDVTLDPEALFKYALEYKQFLDSITLNRQHHLLH